MATLLHPEAIDARAAAGADLTVVASADSSGPRRSRIASADNEPPRVPTLRILPAPSRLGPGLHVAPFRNTGGLPMLLAIDLDERLTAGIELQSVETASVYIHGVHCDGGVEHPAAASDVVRDPHAFVRHGHRLWSPGVYRDPWNASVASGPVVIVLDHFSRLVGLWEFPAHVDLLAGKALAELFADTEEADDIVRSDWCQPAGRP